jgi:hypothetical protein
VRFLHVLPYKDYSTAPARLPVIIHVRLHHGDPISNQYFPRPGIGMNPAQREQYTFCCPAVKLTNLRRDLKIPG